MSKEIYGNKRNRSTFKLSQSIFYKIFESRKAKTKCPMNHVTRELDRIHQEGEKIMKRRMGKEKNGEWNKLILERINQNERLFSKEESKVMSHHNKLIQKMYILGLTDNLGITKYLEKNKFHDIIGKTKGEINKMPNREQAIELLKKYNQEEFHLRHALTVEAVMKYFAKENGEDEEFWGLVGLLHDVDFEKYPEKHCQKAPELLQEIGANEDMIHAICSHGYGICSNLKPEKQMEKILFATDELTGLIWAAAKMRPSQSTKDMEVSSLKKKFKDKKFAAGCSRDTIKQGAEMLGWELSELLEKTILAMREAEDLVEKEMEEIK